MDRGGRAVRDIWIKFLSQCCYVLAVLTSPGENERCEGVWSGFLFLSLSLLPSDGLFSLSTFTPL